MFSNLYSRKVYIWETLNDLASYSTVTLYLQPYVAEYLRTVSRLRSNLRQGVDDLPKTAVYFDKKSKEGRTLISCLEPGNRSCKKQYRLDTPLEVTICDKYRPEYDSRYSFITISDGMCHLLNDLVKDMMISKLHFYVIDRKDEQKEMESIKAWLMFYGIHEDVWQFESAKKALYRARKEIELLEPQRLEVN